MKLSSCWFVLLLVLVVLMAVFMGAADARKKKAGKSSKVCKYDRKGDEGPCNATSNTKEITLQLKKGDPASCQATKNVSKSCSDNSLTKKKKIKGCKYEKKGSDWTECDPATNERSKVMNLKTGSNPECPATRTKTKSCGGNNKKKGPSRSKKEA